MVRFDDTPRKYSLVQRKHISEFDVPVAMFVDIKNRVEALWSRGGLKLESTGNSFIKY